MTRSIYVERATQQTIQAERRQTTSYLSLNVVARAR